MQISSLVEILGGELSNTPSISFIYSIKINDPKRVKEGDLYLTKNIKDIEIAVKNGAFAIVTQEECDIIDNEIAWIRVKNIDDAIIKLLRYKLSNLKLNAYYCDSAIYNLVKIFMKNSKKNIFLIPNKIEKLILNLERLESADIIISSNKTLLDSIFPNNTKLCKTKISKIKNLTKHSLFETSFSYNNIYFSKLKLSSLYINDFLNVYEFLESNLETSKLKDFKYLKPIFLDKNLNIIDFGKSDRFVIYQNDIELAKKEIEHIQKNYSYARTLFISSKKFESLSEDVFTIDDIEKLKYLLKKITFNSLYLIGFDEKLINEIIFKKEEQASLF